MPTRPAIGDPKYWRQRAQDGSRDADQLSDAVQKQIMQGIARAYEDLATIIEAKLGSKSSGQ